MQAIRQRKKVIWKKWEAPPEKIRKKLPKSYFLLPSSRKFPYREWKGKYKGYINCNALKVIIPRAIQTGHKAVYRKAITLYRKDCVYARRR